MGDTTPVSTAHPLALDKSEGFPDLVALYLLTLGPTSRRGSQWRLNLAAGLLTDHALDAGALAWHRLRREHLITLRAALVARYAPATGNALLAHIKGVLAQAWETGLLTADDYLRLCRSIKSIKGYSIPPGRSLSREEIGALFRSLGADSSMRARRDAAILAVLYGTGMRRFELCALEVGDYDRCAGVIAIRHGKGNRGRFCYLPDAGLRQLLDGWLQLRTTAPGWLFCALHRTGRIQYAHQIQGQTVCVALNIWRKRAGLRPFAPHDFRRTVATHLLEAGQDLDTVMRVLGHAQLSTTQKYLRRDEQSKRAAAALLTLPGGAPDTPAPGEHDRHRRPVAADSVVVPRRPAMRRERGPRRWGGPTHSSKGA